MCPLHWEVWGALGRDKVATGPDREGSRVKRWMGEWLVLMVVEGGKVERRPSLSLFEDQWDISGLGNEEAGDWDSFAVIAGTLLPILMSMAQL